MTKYYLNGGDAFRLKLWVDKLPVADGTTDTILNFDHPQSDNSEALV